MSMVPPSHLPTGMDRSAPNTDPVMMDRERPDSGARLNREREFIQAIREYQKDSGRMFPTWSEVLEVAKSLGYVKSEGEES